MDNYKKPLQERGQMYFFSDLNMYAHIYCSLYLYYSSKVWGQMILMLLKEVSYAYQGCSCLIKIQ